MALKADGSLWAWGYNELGQLGGGTTINRYTPVKVMEDVTGISARFDSMAIKTDGSLWVWGGNAYFQFQYAYDDSINFSIPVKVMDDVTAVSSGGNYTLAIKTDGSLWGWGSNFDGQLGDGTYTFRQYPVKIMEGVAAVSASSFHTMAVKTDGSLWAWGKNQHGEFGNGITVDRPTPIKVMDGVRLSAPPIITQPPPSTLRFSDIPASHWAYESIMLLVGKGVISGYEDGTFRPNGLVTRSELAVMMTLALDIPLLTRPVPSFVDVGRSDWEFLYVETAKPYLTGYQQGASYYFRGKEAAVREDMAVALVNAMGLSGQPVNESELRSIFSDWAGISPNLRKHVLIAYKNGLISGYPDGTFGAQRSVTRAETASLLVKVLSSEDMQKVSFD
jgi:hypothetical protein